MKKSQSTTEQIVDAMTTDLAQAGRHLKVARANAERGRFALAAQHPDLWEQVAYVVTELDLLIEKIKKEQGD